RFWIGWVTKHGDNVGSAAVRAELIKRLDVKRPGIRARGDMIGIPLPNILDRWASHTGRCEGATAEMAVPFPSERPSTPFAPSFRCLGNIPLALSPAEYGKLLAEETEKWARIIQAANIKAE